MKYLSLLLVAFVIACGGGQLLSSYRFPIAVPVYVRDLPSGTLQEPPDTVGTWSLALRHMGPAPYPFFSVNQEVFKSLIDTGNFQPAPIIGGGPHSILTYYARDVQRNTEVSGSFSWEFHGDGVGQFSFIVYLKDAKATYAVVFNIKDNRFDTYEPFVSHDTFTTFLSVPPGKTKFATTEIGEKFKVAISEANWKEINAALGASDPVITQYGLLHEAYVQDGQYTRTYLEVSDFDITRW